MGQWDADVPTPRNSQFVARRQPCTATIVDFYRARLTIVEDRLLPILIYEYVSGGSVEGLFESKTAQCGKTWRPPRVVSLSWCHQLLRALAFLHEH
eukprot:3024262-Rhodomonas_salina.2